MPPVAPRNPQTNPQEGEPRFSIRWEGRDPGMVLPGTEKRLAEERKAKEASAEGGENSAPAEEAAAAAEFSAASEANNSLFAKAANELSDLWGDVGHAVTNIFAVDTKEIDMLISGVDGIKGSVEPGKGLAGKEELVKGVEVLIDVILGKLRAQEGDLAPAEYGFAAGLAELFGLSFADGKAPSDSDPLLKELEKLKRLVEKAEDTMGVVTGARKRVKGEKVAPAAEFSANSYSIADGLGVVKGILGAAVKGGARKAGFRTLGAVGNGLKAVVDAADRAAQGRAGGTSGVEVTAAAAQLSARLEALEASVEELLSFEKGGSAPSLDNVWQTMKVQEARIREREEAQGMLEEAAGRQRANAAQREAFDAFGFVATGVGLHVAVAGNTFREGYSRTDAKGPVDMVRRYLVGGPVPGAEVLDRLQKIIDEAGDKANAAAAKAKLNSGSYTPEPLRGNLLQEVGELNEATALSDRLAGLDSNPAGSGAKVSGPKVSTVLKAAKAAR